MFSIERDEKQDLRLAILAAARELVAHGGSDRLSMRTLAQRIGCSPGTIYLYFENKSELLQYLAEENGVRLSQVLVGLRERHRRGDPVALLKKALYTWVEFGLSHAKEYRASWAQPSCKHGPSILREFVIRCVEEDAFRRDIDVESACLTLWATIHGLTSLLIVDSVQKRGAVIAQVIHCCVEGLLEKSSRPRANAASVA